MSTKMNDTATTGGFRITGSDAIRLAERDNLTIHCHANPVDNGGIVTPDQARGIVREDPSLVYVLVTPRGESPEGYNIHDYWSMAGRYLGPDCDGIEPTFDDAPQPPAP